MQTLTNLEQWFLINYITLIVYKSGLGNCIYPDCLQAYILTSPYLKEYKSEAGAIYFITPDKKKKNHRTSYEENGLQKPWSVLQREAHVRTPFSVYEFFNLNY